MFEKLRYFSRRITFKIFITMFLFILPINLFIVLLNNHVMKSIREEITISVKSVLENHIAMLENRMSIGSNLLWHMKYDNVNGITLLNKTDDSLYSFYKAVFFYDAQDMIALSDGLDAYFFYIEDTEDIMVWNKTRSNSIVIKDYLETQYENDCWRKGWNLENFDGREILCLYVEQKGVSYGGWIDLNDVKEMLENDIQYENDEFTFTPYEDAPQEDMIQVVGKSKRGDFFINAYLDSGEIQGQVIDANIYVLLGTIASVFVFPFLYLVIRKLLLTPLKTLNKAFNKVEIGDWDYRITENAHSLEFEHSFQAFNVMTEHIKDLKIENYEKEIEKEKLELMNLQLQIRPHFLLNSFSLIYTLTYKNENHTIQEIILYLSKYFRYLFRSGNSLELFRKEQELLEGYIKMAQVRYPDSIEIEYEYDPEIMYVRVPPLLLHNFVENIIKHVVKIGTVTHISVIGQYEDKVVTFMILDDGQGIPEQSLKELDASMRKEMADGAHVGFANSLRRVKYFYGESANIVLKSTEGEGTCITITFPYNLEEDK